MSTATYWPGNACNVLLYRVKKIQPLLEGVVVVPEKLFLGQGVFQFT